MEAALRSLRDRQVDLARESIIEATLTLLRANHPDVITFQQIADQARVAVRTVYRHFGTRSELFRSVGDWLYSNVFKNADWDDPDSVGNLYGFFPAAPKTFERNLHIFQAIALAGETAIINQGMRDRRQTGIVAAVDRAGRDASPAERGYAETIIPLLESHITWLALYDQLQSSAVDVVTTIDWAASAILLGLEQRDEVQAILEVRPGDGRLAGRQPAASDAAAKSSRDERVDRTREEIVQAFHSLLRTNHPSDVTYTDIAEQAGVSLRTVYRYFPSRADLGSSAAAWFESLSSEVDWEHEATITSLGAVAPEIGRMFDQHINVFRVFAQTDLSLRTVRRRAARRAVERVEPNATPDDTRRATTMIARLRSTSAWLALHDGPGLSGSEICELLDWSSCCLLNALHFENSASWSRNYPHS